MDVDRDGNIHVSSFATRSEIKVFAPNGRLLRVIGRAGSGPGEFKRIHDIDVRGDRILVTDVENGRFALISRDGRTIRTWNTPGILITPGGILPLPNDELIANASVPARQLAGLPLHRIDQRGRLVGSFGSETGEYRADAAFLMVRRMAGSRFGGFWVAHATNYRLEKWTTTGARTQTIIRDASWFRPWYEASYITPRTPSKPNIVDIAEDSLGRLWVAVEIPSPRQAAALSPATIENQQLFAITHPDSAYDSVLEVIDPRTGLVMSESLPHMVVRLLPGNLIVTYTEDANGAPSYSIWRAVVDREAERADG